LFLRACVSKKKKSQSLAQADQSGGQGHGLPRLPCGAIDGFCTDDLWRLWEREQFKSLQNFKHILHFVCHFFPEKGYTEREGQNELWDDSPGGKAGTQLKKN
jgi:hypothetical protein